jgi:hypothetical protein
MRVAVACGLALLVVAVAGATAATTHPGLDRSYGKAGVVDVVAPAATNEEQFAAVKGFGVAADGAAYSVGNVYPCLPARCRRGAFLFRLTSNGSPVQGFGEEGVVYLHGEDQEPTVFADSAGRAVVVERRKGKTVLRRFEPSGAVDRSFGRAGLLELRGLAGEEDPEIINLPGGRLMLVATEAVRGKKEREETVATKVHVSELLPNGRDDKHFGRSGAIAFTIPRRGPLASIARTPGGAMVFGSLGSWRQSTPTPWLWRVDASGHADRRFNRDAVGSLRRLGRLGEFSELAALLPRPDGSVAMVGTIHEHLGFVLRLRANGRLDPGFGDRGLASLPATVEGAVAGSGGAIFIVGQGKRHFFYSAYRVLGDGRLDPGYRGARGIKVPLPGEGVAVAALTGGRALVTDIGYFECREGCPPEPGMVRFLE